jgi:Suppressor of fused protein (SUFU)
MVPPTPDHPYCALITTGMSDRPANIPEGAEKFRYTELLICLPPDWAVDEKAFKKEENYWPVRWLKMLARLPHEYDTWLGHAHTVPNGDPPEPFASNTKLCCALISLPTLFGDDFVHLKVNEEKTITFLSFIPIYREEMEFKLTHGGDALFQRLESGGVTELLEINRKSVCA